MSYCFRVYYVRDERVNRSHLLEKRQALALFRVHSDAFLVTKEAGWWRRVLRWRLLSVPVTKNPLKTL
ncbi:hypothetical protein LCGC14_3049710 [marine sediment metagenome]|uniref:Uncharacterized protein n=1 Tax=marine sediment metagenome TaxID=412755 RepID=A0A0F8WML4_9ZZZZ